MRYGSVCSGIEAATAAWHPLGWEPAYFSEIDKFPRAVLKHHYPAVPLHGDFTTIGDEYGPIDILVGGTPCQSFSVAGLRGGLDDDRGNLSLEFLKLAQRSRATWVVWENVPGVLSSSGGRDFGAILGGLVELGYGFAYRVLDAQYFGVPQRRRRVFVVGYLGDWRPAAAVLLERESMLGHPPPSRGKGQETTRNTSPGIDLRNGEITNQVAQTVQCGAKPPSPSEIPHCLAFNWQNGGGYGEANDGLGITEEGTGPLQTAQIPAVAFKPSHYTRGKDGAPSETFPPLSADADKGDQDPIIFQPRYARNDRGAPDTIAGPLTAEAGRTGKGDSAQCVAFAQNSRDEVREMPVVGAQSAEPGAKQQSYVRSEMQVRRLTPRECERLQGFPDDYTRIPWRGKDPENCPDGPRYKALGNSMAVPVMHWIGKRIQMVEEML